MPDSVYKSLLVTDRGILTRNTTKVHFILSLPISSKITSSISLPFYSLFPLRHCSSRQWHLLYGL